jgi:hypothetical protein
MLWSKSGDFKNICQQKIINRSCVSSYFVAGMQNFAQKMTLTKICAAQRRKSMILLQHVLKLHFLRGWAN